MKKFMALAIAVMLLLSACTQKPGSDASQPAPDNTPAQDAATPDKAPENTPDSTDETPAPESTPAPTETPAPEADEPEFAPDADLPAELNSFRIQLDKDVFALPVPYGDFTAAGWTLVNSADAELMIDGYLSEQIAFTKGDVKLICIVLNPEGTARPAKNCSVSGMIIDAAGDAKGLTAYLPGGLLMGMATLDDVLSAYGEPGAREDADGKTVLTYKTENVWCYTKLSFDASGLLTGYESDNFVIRVTETESSPTDLEQPAQ